MRVYYATDSNNVESVSDMNKTNFVHPRDQIVDIMQRIYGYGMTTTSGGNLSILDSDGNMWISPASVDKGTLRREDIVCVKPDGTVTEFPVSTGALTEAERQIIADGCLINYYRNNQ